MSETTPVVAAVPNYNMGQHLQELLPTLLEQGYDRVYVLDDASTDGSQDVVRSLDSDVTLVAGRENQGAAANRNRIIEHVVESALIHFIDADMDVAPTKTPLSVIAKDTMARYAPNIGAVGGLVCRADGSQEPYNFGPVFSLGVNLTAGLPLIIDRLKNTHPQAAKAIQQTGNIIMKDWPDVLAEPKARPAFWLHEGNMLMYAALFKRIGGYDPNLRFHETQDLSIRLEKLGIKRQFDPAIKTTHHYIDVRGEARSQEKRRAAAYLIQKHGLKQWLTGVVKAEDENALDISP